MRMNMRDTGADDEWLGFKDSDTHYKVLNVKAFEFFEALVRRKIPPAQRTPPVEEGTLAARRHLVQALATKFPKAFHVAHQADVLRVIALQETTEPIPFNWSGAVVRSMYYSYNFFHI